MRLYLIVGWTVLCMGTASAQDSSVAQFLESAFSPQRATERKSMGLLQRSFLDLVEDAQPKLQIALVIDGTDSMEVALDGVRKTFKTMAEDLSRYKDNVSFQVVVYRDVDSKSGTIQLPLQISNNGFTTDTSEIFDALKNVQPESGAPYFHELIDLGIHTAITKLDWSSDDDTTRWILIFGDAPPFEEKWNEPETKSERRYSTDRIITLARSKNIRISSVLCVSKPEVKEAYDAAVRESRQFMATLANETDGLMLDLSYENIRDALLQASKKPSADYQKEPIEEISKSDIQSVRDLANQDKLLISPDRQTRLAILPYQPLDKISFDSEEPKVQFASELRYKFRQIPGVSVKSSRQVEEVYETLIRRGYRDQRLLMAMANKLRVDYVLWGKSTGSDNNQQLVPIVFDRSKGTPAAISAVAVSNTQSTAGLLADRVLRSVTVRNDMVARLDRDQESMLVMVANNQASVEPLMGALDALEKCLSFKVGSPESNKLAAQAKKQLDQTLASADDNALAHYLMTSYYFNRAQSDLADGNQDEAQKSMRGFTKSLRDAYKYRTRQSSTDLQQEIKGLYDLLIKKDVPAAIETFESLTESGGETRLQTARRAHWMLAGIYAADWGVDQKWADSKRARGHLIKILAFFESSPEAEFIREALRWDAEEGKTKFRYLPLSNGKLSKMIDA